MIFTSEAFIIFAAVFFPAYFAMPGARSQNAVALAGSAVFYGWWDWRFLGLIGAVTLVNFLLAPLARQGRAWLWAAVAFNLGLLGLFKYFGFFVEQAVAGLQALGLAAHRPALSLILPVGISFFTFQALSYTLDVARGRMAPERDPLRFATYIALFPQLVAGPVVRARRLLPQLARPRRFTWANFWLGTEQVLTGAVLKIVIADRLAPLADRVFAGPEAYGPAGIAFGVLCFAVQIYADFAGYSLIAIGLGRIMGLRFRVNFRRPYMARDLRGFWRRWHISLSTWLRDYLYIPLGGSRRGAARRDLNLVLTMGLGGLWHGAGWPFVAWGLLHGAGLVATRRLGMAPVARWPARLGLFATVCLAWVFFRAPDLATAGAVLAGIAGAGPGQGLPGDAVSRALASGLIATLLAAEALTEDSATARRLTRHRAVRLVRAGAFVLALPLLGVFTGEAFVYFRF